MGETQIPLPFWLMGLPRSHSKLLRQRKMP